MPIALNGCAAVLVGGLHYHDSKTRDQRLSFTQDFNKQNFECEKAGLQPLGWCNELYKFDQSWYAEDGNCKAAAEKAKTAIAGNAAPTATPSSEAASPQK
jgi:hypothetical protein